MRVLRNPVGAKQNVTLEVPDWTARPLLTEETAEEFNKQAKKAKKAGRIVGVQNSQESEKRKTWRKAKKALGEKIGTGRDFHTESAIDSVVVKMQARSHRSRWII